MRLSAMLREVTRSKWRRLPSIDMDEYPPIKGMEGPFRYRDGRILYYDPKEGRYYDRKTDLYLARNDIPEEVELDSSLLSERKKAMTGGLKEAKGFKVPSPGKFGFVPKKPDSAFSPDDFQSGEKDSLSQLADAIKRKKFSIEWESGSRDINLKVVNANVFAPSGSRAKPRVYLEYKIPSEWRFHVPKKIWFTVDGDLEWSKVNDLSSRKRRAMESALEDLELDLIDLWDDIKKDAISEAKGLGFKLPSPSELAQKIQKKKKKKKASKSKLGVDTECMKSYRGSDGNFDSFDDCVAAFSDCSRAKSPEGLCASLMVHRKQAKPKMGVSKKKDEEE